MTTVQQSETDTASQRTVPIVRTVNSNAIPDNSGNAARLKTLKLTDHNAPDSVFSKWCTFGSVILDPWVFIPLGVAAVFLYMAWQVKNEPASTANVRLDTILSIASALMSGFVGSRVEKSWQKHSEQTVLQARGRAAIRDLLLLLRMLSDARHRLGRFIQETDLEPESKSVGIFNLDSETRTLSHCIDNSFGHWTDIVPAEDIQLQLDILRRDELDLRIGAMENERHQYQQQISAVEGESFQMQMESQSEIDRLASLATESQADRQRLQNLTAQLEQDKRKADAEVRRLNARVDELSNEISRSRERGNTLTSGVTFIPASGPIDISGPRTQSLVSPVGTVGSCSKCGKPTLRKRSFGIGGFVETVCDSCLNVAR